MSSNDLTVDPHGSTGNQTSGAADAAGPANDYDAEAEGGQAAPKLMHAGTSVENVKVRRSGSGIVEIRLVDQVEVERGEPRISFWRLLKGLSENQWF